jgi:hypothetical protein
MKLGFSLTCGAVLVPLLVHLMSASTRADFTNDGRTIRITGRGYLCTHAMGITLCPPPATKAYYSLHFFVDGGRLRAKVRQVDLVPAEDLPSVSRDNVLEKNGWYVSADYSQSPPRVVLTREPTKYSQWRFVAATGRSQYYIQNINDLHMDAYLAPHAGATPLEACQPILSREPKVSFWVGDPKD